MGENEDRLIGAFGARLDVVDREIRDIKKVLEKLKDGRVPPWLWGIVGPVLAVYVAHLLK